MQKVILDFDDFREDANCLDQLYRMRARWPGFKASLYTIPMQCSKPFLEEVSKIDWLELHVHGFEHTRNECKGWSRDQADRSIRTALGLTNSAGKPIFARGFKAPGWGYNAATLDACAESGLIIATNDDRSNSDGAVVPAGARTYQFRGDMMTEEHGAAGWDRYHGHLQVPDCDNDIPYTWHWLQDRIGPDAKFYFITEAVDELYGKQ